MPLNDKHLGLHFLENSLNIQIESLDILQQRLGGNKIIVDPNNVFCFLLEMMSEITSNSVLSTEKELESLYPKRARTYEDLFKHMSDFDYVGLYSTPASTMINLTLDKKYLYKNSKDFNQNYKKVVIPKDTVFQLGKYNFSLYYPIEIRFNKNVDSVITVYDTTQENPLFKLSSSSVKSHSHNASGLDLISLQFPVYQFERLIAEEPTIAATGFNKKYQYKNNFYAARIYHFLNGEWVELNQTVSEMVYDHNTPTVRLKVDEENKRIGLSIPTIYFTNEKIGSKLWIEIYTTHGELDTKIGNLTTNNIKMDFAFKSKNTTEYSHILKHIPTQRCVPIDNKITGGGNGYDFEQLRSRVTNDSFYDDVLIRSSQLENCLMDKGFKLEKHKDNITDRIYYAYRTLKDVKGSIVQTTNTIFSIYEDTIDKVSSIRRNNNGTLTIMPTTLYRYMDSVKSAIPVEDDELLVIADKSKYEIVQLFNKETFTRSPFHIHLINDERYPRAVSYNLLSPEAKDIYFDKENIDIASQMVLHTAIIQHLNSGTGGYRIRMGVTKSSDLANISIQDQMVYVFCKNIYGNIIGLEAHYIGDLDGQNVFEFVLKTEYELYNDSIKITNLEGEIPHTDNFIPLDAKFSVVFLLKNEHVNNTSNTSELVIGIPDSIKNNYTVMSRQNMTLLLGHNLQNVIHNPVVSRWTERKYAKHEIDVYSTYPEDVYKKDENGVFIYNIENGSLILELEHKAGDVILDDKGEPYIKYAIGDNKIDAFGNPIMIEDRHPIYDINMMHLDARQFISEHPTQIEYRENMISMFEAYFSSIRATSPQLIEQTELYFRPIKTMGTAQFGIGNNVILRRSLQLTFKIKCFVKEHVHIDSSLQETLTDNIISLIEEMITNKDINMVDISNKIKEQLDEYITHINVLGIDDNTELQTLLVVDSDAQPSIAQELYLTKENTLALRKKIDIEYILG